MSVIESRPVPTEHAEYGSPDRQRDDGRLRSFLTVGLDLAGPAGRQAHGLLTGGTDHPFRGTTADWALLRTLIRAADDFAHRSLSDRERVRTAAVLLSAAHRLNANLEAGLGVRRDDFFATTPARRAAADEVAEAILLAAQHEHEEAKVPFLGNLLVNLAFRDGTDRAQANGLVRLAGALSYRQLGLLTVFAHTERFDLRTTDYQGPARVPFAAVAVLQEVFELVRLSLVVQTTGDPITLRDLTPGRITVAGTGAMLLKLMHLNAIDPDETDTLATLLR